MTTIVKTLYAKALSVLKSRLALMIMCYTVIMSIVTIIRHYTFFSAAWDLGIFNQAFWSTLHGRFFYYDVEPWFGECFFGVHFSPIIIFLVPFYAVYPSPVTLLVLQSFIIALGAVPLYYLAKDELSEKLALLFSFLYLTYPLLIGANIFDFHLEAFIPVTLLSTMYFLKKKNLKFYVLSLILFLMSLEFAPFLTLLIALYLFVTKFKAKGKLKEVVAYVVLTVSLSVVWLFLGFAVRFYLRPPETAAMSILTPVLSEIGDPLQLLGYLVANPYGKFIYLVLMLAPLLFTSLFSSYFLLALPWILLTFTLNYGPYYEIGYQYPLVIIPFIFLSSIYGIKKILHSTALKKENFTKLLFISSLFFLIGSTTLAQPYLAFNIERIDTAHRFISLVPENASILTTNKFFPHMSNRFNVWVLPSSYDEPFPQYHLGISIIRKEYTIRFLNESNPDFILLDFQVGAEAQNVKLITSKLLTRRHYGVYAWTDGILLLKRDYEGDPVIFTPLNLTFNYKSLRIYDGSKVADPTSKSGIVLAHTTRDFDNVTFWTAPRLTLPPGEYNITFKLKLGGNAQNVSVMLLDAETDERAQILNSTVVHVSDFEELNTWKGFSLAFPINEFSTGVELRGWRVSNKVDVYLDYVEVVQLSWKPNNVEG